MPSVPRTATSRGPHWQGDVPSQRPMSFCTKVHSRFVGKPRLTTGISFTVAASPDVTEAKVGETRVALRELGLSEDLEQC